MAPRKLPPAGRILLVLLLATVLLGATVGQATELPASVYVLPESTAVLVSVLDVPEAIERFENTALGRMMRDPQVRPLVDHVIGSVMNSAAGLEKQLGFTLRELLSIPQGEVTLAIVTPEQSEPVVVAFFDAGRQAAAFNELLIQAGRMMERSGAERIEDEFAGALITAFQGMGGDLDRMLVLSERDNIFIICTDLEVTLDILANWDTKVDRTLLDNDKFSEIVNRSSAPNQDPQLLAYVDPFALLESTTRTKGAGGANMLLAMAPVLGLDGIKAVGGAIAWDVELFDSITHAHLLLERPREGALKLAAFRSGDTTPEPWVPSDVASYTTLHFDPAQLYEAAVYMVDGFRGEGAFSASVGAELARRTGVHLEQDLLPALAGRISHINWIEQPVVSMTSNAQLVGLKLRPEAEFQQVLDRIYQDDAMPMRRDTLGGYIYYELDPGSEASQEPGRPAPNSPCVGLINDYLILADRAAIYREVIQTASRPVDSLAGALDFKLISGKIDRYAGSTVLSMRSFTRPDRSMHMMYDVLASQQAGETLTGRARRNPLLQSFSKAVQSNPLPPFSVLKKYLAPGGAVLVDDASGVHYTSFSLRRD